MALIIKGDMPSICKKCKSQGGLTDGSFNYICCDDNYLDFYCEGDNPNGCQILCEIPDNHGRLIDVDGLMKKVREEADFPSYEWSKAIECLEEAPSIVEATNE